MKKFNQIFEPLIRIKDVVTKLIENNYDLTSL
jgi:hypothetical protein